MIVLKPILKQVKMCMTFIKGNTHNLSPEQYAAVDYLTDVVIEQQTMLSQARDDIFRLQHQLMIANEDRVQLQRKAGNLENAERIRQTNEGIKRRNEYYRTCGHGWIG